MFPSGVQTFFPSPLSTLGSLLLTTFFDVYQSYNIFMLALYVGSAWTMYLLAYHITQHRLASFLAGFIFAFSHLSLTQHVLGHLSEGNFIFVPLVFLFLLKLSKNPNLKNWMLFTGSGMGVCLTSTYIPFEVFVVGVPVCTLFLSRQKKFTIKLALGLLVIFIVALTAYAPVLAIRKDLVGGSEVNALSFFSFFDFPAWHPALFIQKLRTFTAFQVNKEIMSQVDPSQVLMVGLYSSPERLMGYLGITVVFFLVWGGVKGILKQNKMWVALGLMGIILSLGSTLRIPFSEIRIPLPYLLFEKLPLFENFRNPSRMILLTWISVSLLSALGFKKMVGKIKVSSSRNLLLVAILLFYSWEMGLFGIGRLVTPLHGGDIYQTIKEDDSEFGVLELPAFIKKNGDVSINVQHHMMTQPLHGKPLVLGRPGRHTKESLIFTQTTDTVYELTHPHTLIQLYENPDLKKRREVLKKNSRGVLKTNKIKYIVFHQKGKIFSEKTKNLYKRFLKESLGQPALEDPFGRLLFQIYE